VSVERLFLFGLDERRKLHEPCGGGLRHHWNEPFASVPRQLAECFEQRVIRFFTSEPLNTLPANGMNIAVMRRALLEQVHQFGFPDPRLAGDKDELPLASYRPLEMIFQLCQRYLTAHYGTGIFLGRTPAGGGFVDHLSDELISPLAQRLNERRLFRPVVQVTSDFQDGLLYDFRVYMSIRPDGIQKLILRNQTRPVIHQ